MSMTEQTVKCPICSKPYKVYAYYAGDQSACRSCVSKAKDNSAGTDFRDFNREGQREYFGK